MKFSIFNFQFSNTKSGQIPQLNSGQAVITAVIFLLFISLIVISGFSATVLRETKIARNSLVSKQSYFSAEAGMEDAIYRIKTGKQISLDETITLNGGTVNTTISDTVEGNKSIVSTGDVSSNIRKAQMTLVASAAGIDFFYGAQVGEGGIEMDQGARIEGAGGTPGNVYSNGSIEGATGATITGDATVATGITEDNQARSTVYNQRKEVGKADPYIDYAQSFVPSATGPLAKISIYIEKEGNPSSRNVRIVADNGGSPNTTEMASGVLNASLVGTDPAWIDIVFSNPPNLIEEQRYWIVLDANRNSNNYWRWWSDSNNGFGNGVGKYSEDWDDDPWTQITGDLTFKTYTGEGISLINNMAIDGAARANTINNSVIGGDAYYQTIDLDTIVNGTKNPNSADPPLLNMPISDANIAQFKADATGDGTNTINGDCGDSGDPSCIINDDGTLSLGPAKITGNLNLSGRQTLIVTGTLYIVGNIDVSGTNVNIKCDASFGGNSCVIITDGWVHISNNATFSGSGQTDSYLMILTTLSDCNGNGGTGCTHHDGAVDIHNNATGAIFYASDSMINLHNNVDITSAVGYKLRLDNNATITYEIGIADLNFSSGPSGGWSIRGWQED